MKNALLVAGGMGVAAAILLACGGHPPLPPAEAQTVADAGGESPAIVMGIGGSQQNQNDLCWLLFKEKGRGKETDRYALCLYKVFNNGQGFDLLDVREVTYDPKIVQLNAPGHNPRVSPQAMKKAYEDALKEEKKAEEEEAKRKRNP